VLSVASGLHADLGADAAGVVVTQVMPYPFTELGNPVVREYQKTMGALDDAKFSYNSMEGFINAKLVANALRRRPPVHARQADRHPEGPEQRGPRRFRDQLRQAEQPGLALRCADDGAQGRHLRPLGTWI
jgi:hypothetical protein